MSAGASKCGEDGTAICANGKTVSQAARDWIDAAARCDLEAIAAGMADECLRYGEPNWMVMSKPDYIRGYRQFLQSFSDYRLEVLNQVTSGRAVVFEMIESAKFSNPYKMPDGSEIPANGESYTDRVCTWVEVGESGLITEIRAYIPSTRGPLLAAAAAESL